MKKINYTGKSKQDLVKVLGEKRETLRKLRFGASGSKSRNVKEPKLVKKDIARIMTELNSSTGSTLLTTSTLTTSKSNG